MCEACGAFQTRWETSRPPSCSNPSLMTGSCCCENNSNCAAVRWHRGHTIQPLIDIQKEWIAHLEKSHGPSRSHKGNGAYQGPFAFTLTKSPKDALTAQDLINAAKKLMNQKSCRVIKYAWNLEYKGKDEAGLPAHPHIHGMYETITGGRIEAKHFKRAWPIWDEKVQLGNGFRGGYHRPIADEESYTKYIAKDGGIGETSGQF